MSSTKLALAYFCLVGIPLAGVVGILWFGQRLVAPLSVSGSWNVEMDLGALRSHPCMESLVRIRQPFLDVSQSGNTLIVRLGDRQQTILPGSIRLTKLRIGATSAQTRDCHDPRLFQLEATVNGPGDRRTLTGRLAIAGCAGCEAIPFSAVRRTR